MNGSSDAEVKPRASTAWSGTNGYRESYLVHEGIGLPTDRFPPLRVSGSPIPLQISGTTQSMKPAVALPSTVGFAVRACEVAARIQRMKSPSVSQ